MSWRLPSGKALAEFALQAGFLAPLMLGGPNVKKRKKPASMEGGAPARAGVEKPAGEGPEQSGSFRSSSYGADRYGVAGDGARAGAYGDR